MGFAVTKRQCWKTIASAENALQTASPHNVGMRRNEISVALSETLVCGGMEGVGGDEFSPVRLGRALGARALGPISAPYGILRCRRE